MVEGEDGEVEVKVLGVFPVSTSQGEATPVVLLEDSRSRVLPIYIGLAEAMAIYYALEGITTPRPMTHDLIVSILSELGVEVEKIVIDDLQEGVYYARLCLRGDGIYKEIDARPSDCIAIALRTKSKIYVLDRIMREAGMDKSQLFETRVDDTDIEPPE